MNQPAYYAILALLAVGSYGWGRCLVELVDRARRPRSAPGATRLPGAIVLTIGLAVYLAFGGFVVALDVGRLRVLAGFLGVGAVIAALDALRRLRASGPHLPRRSTVLTVVAMLPPALLAYGSMMSGPVNVYDDDPAYSYLAQRLLSTGGLVDPFSFRRVTSYGAGEVLQVLALRTAGPGHPLGIEWFFSVVLCGALLVRRTSRPWAPLGAIVGTTVLAVFKPVGDWANSAPTFSCVALFLAMLQLLALDDGAVFGARTATLVGVLAAGAVALRIQFAAPVVVAVVLVAVVRRRRGAWRPLAVALASGTVTLAGWMAALERSSGTPLFLLTPGTYNARFPWADPAFHGVAAYLGRVRGELGIDGWWLEAIALIVAAAIVGRVARRSGSWRASPGAVVVLAGLLGCAVELVSATRSLSGGALADVGRYDTPCVLAVALVAADELWAAAAAAAASAARVARRRTVALVAIGVVCLTESIVRVGLPSGTPPRTVQRAASYDVRGVLDTINGTLVSQDRWVSQLPRYTAINAVVPRGAYVLAAVDYPGLLDFSKFRFATLDVPGAASPAPGIPILEGERAVVTYLRDHGFDGIVATVTSVYGLYDYRSWAQNLTSGIEDYRAMGREFVAWSHVLSALASDPQIRRTRVGVEEYLAFAPRTSAS